MKTFNNKLTAVDTAVADNKPVGTLSVKSEDWEAGCTCRTGLTPLHETTSLWPQAAIESFRNDFYRLGVPLRPPFFPVQVAEPILIEDPAEAATPSPSSSPQSACTDTETLFLQCRGAVQGVLQLHKASRRYSVRRSVMSSLILLSHACKTEVESQELQGYSFLWRTDEVWRIMRRAQQFQSWYSKLLDRIMVQDVGGLNTTAEWHPRWGQQGYDLASAWRVCLAGLPQQPHNPSIRLQGQVRHGNSPSPGI